MKKLMNVGLLILFSASIFSMSFTGVLAEPDADTEKAEKVELTKEQKSELDTLYKDMLKTKKQIIMKYEKFGVISTEKAEKKMEWMEKHYRMIKDNDFIPKNATIIRNTAKMKRLLNRERSFFGNIYHTKDK